MAITRYRPTTDLLRPFFEDLIETSWGGRMAGMDLLRTPDADVMESKDDIHVMIELPGLRPEDVDITLENNVLTVSGEKREEQREEDADHRWHLSERRYGRFDRSFVLPREVDADRIQARIDNGVLNVTIPKSEKAKPRHIQIRGGDGERRVQASTSKR